MGILGGGGDREWLEPLDELGNKERDIDEEFDTMVGCHTGTFFGLNVYNPEPGFEYVWERDTQKDKLRCIREGGRPVDANDREFAAVRHVLGAEDGAPLDSLNIFNDVVLFKYPESAIRRKREQEQNKAQSMLRGGAQSFTDRATEAERMFAHGRSTRFARADHRNDFEDSSGNLVDQWNPDKGIIE